MRKTLVTVAIVLAIAVGIPAVVWAVGDISTPMGTQPDLTPQLTIRRPLLTATAGQPIPIVVEYQNFHADPAARCNPAGTCLGSLPNTVTGPEGATVDVGHVHVYFTPGYTSVGNIVQARSFCIPSTVNEVDFSGTITGNCNPLPAGIYRVSAEFQSNSHVSSLKANNSPQHIPVSDDHLVVVR